MLPNPRAMTKPVKNALTAAHTTAFVNTSWFFLYWLEFARRICRPDILWFNKTMLHDMSIMPVIAQLSR